MFIKIKTSIKLFIMNDKSIEQFKEKNEVLPCSEESYGLLSFFIPLEETKDAQKSSDEMEPAFFKNIKRQIENNISDLKTVVDDLNKLRGS